MAGSVFINDSFNFSGRVPGQLNQYPEVRFRYRVASDKRIAEYDNATGEHRLDIGAAIICDHLLSFDALNDDGKTWEAISMTVNVVRTLYRPIWWTMLNSILQLVGPSVETEAGKSPAP